MDKEAHFVNEFNNQVELENRKESIKMNDLVDLRLHHHIAQELYRQHMLQRLPGKKSSTNRLMNHYSLLLVSFFVRCHLMRLIVY